LQFLVRTHLAESATYRGLARSRATRQLALNRWIAKDVSAHLAPQIDSRTDFRLDPVLKKSVSQSPLPIYLRVEDRNSSAHSVEVRVPFLDHRLVELLFGLPDRWHMRGPWNKYVQREAMRGRIPEVVRSRAEKMGFPTPVQKWIAGPLYEPLRELFASQKTRDRGVYNVEVVLADLDRHHRGEGTLSAPIFDLAQFELWCRHSETEQSELSATRAF
jgi:asparagine synthase (glutamine-hydrolysing)